MKELRGYRYRIYPDAEQSVQIAKTVGCARLMYNLLLADYKSQIGGDEKPKLHEVTYFKEDRPFLSEVDSLALANAKQNLHAALTNWSNSKKGKRKGKKVRFPKFHAKSKSRLTYTTNNQNGTVRIEGDRIKLLQVGVVHHKYSQKNFAAKGNSCFGTLTVGVNSLHLLLQRFV